jgi:hypothetical protein
MKYIYKTQEVTRSGSLKSNSRYDSLEKQRYLAIEAARTNWEYQTELNAPTVVENVKQYGDWLLTQLRRELIRCVAFKEEDGSQLTSATINYWKIFPKAKLVPEPVVRVYSIGGKLGSLAAYTCCQGLNWSAKPLELSKEITESVWKELLVSPELSPVSKLKALFINLDLDFEYVRACEKALKLKSQSGDFKLRQHALDANAFDRLPLRILLSEVSLIAIKYWSEFHVEANLNPTVASNYSLPNAGYGRPYHHFQMCVALGQSAGFSFLLQTLACEMLAKAYEVIADLPELLTLDVLERDPNFTRVREGLSARLNAIAEAISIQGTFGALTSAEARSQEWVAEANRWGGYKDLDFNIKDLLI